VRVGLAIVLSGVVVGPPASQALPGQESDPDDDSGHGSIEIDIEVDRADELDIENAFGEIRDNVEGELAALTSAEQAVQAADLAVTEAEGRVAAVQVEIDGLVGQSDEVVVRRFMNPPSQAAIDALTATSVNDATVKQAILQMQADADAAVIDRLHDLEAELQEQREAEEAARADASDRREQAELALADLEEAASQQVTFALEVERRLERNLGEMEYLRQTDPGLAEQLQGQVDTLAQQVADSRVQIEQEDRLRELDIDLPTVDGPSTIDVDAIEGGIISVTCPSGGEIQVHREIADSTRDLLNLSHQEGLVLCGNGYRSISSQIALRRANCSGDVYSAPASSCSPPTARPGQSMHERGLAIDFTCNGGSIGSSSPCFRFLMDNAPDFGLHNLPGEPWHFSSDGT
jgi:LAS superfamily LD-carboxypeptidase LdcB